MNKCEWKKELVDGSPGKYVKTGLVFYPCERVIESKTKESWSMMDWLSNSPNIFFCPFCGADIRKPDPS